MLFLTFLFGFLYSAETMDGAIVVPQIAGIGGRILECNSMSGVALTWLFIGHRGDKNSLQVTRQTTDYNAKIRSWKTYEFIPLDKISILDSLNSDKYEMVFSSSVMDFKFILTKPFANNPWKGHLKLNKELYLDLEGREFFCRPQPELANWVDKRILGLKSGKK